MVCPDKRCRIKERQHSKVCRHKKLATLPNGVPIIAKMVIHGLENINNNPGLLRWDLQRKIEN